VGIARISLLANNGLAGNGGEGLYGIRFGGAVPLIFANGFE